MYYLVALKEAGGAMVYPTRLEELRSFRASMLQTSSTLLPKLVKVVFVRLDE